VLFYFAPDLWRIARTWTASLWQPARRGELDARIGWYVIAGTLPIGILGLIFEDQIQTVARNLWLIAGTLIVLGVVLGVADRVGRHAKPIAELGLRDALLYGAAQACALIPGVSRSGATISMGLFLGYERAAATRYAFLLAIPAVVAAGLFQIPDVVCGDSPYDVPQTLLATVLAFAVGYASIAWLLRYVSTHSYLPFVVYRICLGALILVLLIAGELSATGEVSAARPAC
jgi:undecaprenyl-diphosphatase